METIFGLVGTIAKGLLPIAGAAILMEGGRRLLKGRMDTVLGAIKKLFTRACNFVFGY